MLADELKEIKKVDRRAEWEEACEVEWIDDGGKLVVPKALGSNLRWQIWLSNVEVRGVDDGCGVRNGIIKRCREDVLFFFNGFLWTVDPRKGRSEVPFLTWGYEDGYVKWVMDHVVGGKDCLTEKSRDMGATWCVLGVLVHQWLFRENFLAHVGSKKEDDVDRGGDIRSLFEKMRYMVRKLPRWMVPYGFDWKKHSNYMRLMNPANGSAVTGESSNIDFGRGGRYNCVYLDEFASMEYATEAWTATGDSAPCRIVTSTPKGTGNKFWELRYKSGIDRYTLHWTMHPDKSKGCHVVGKSKEPLIANNYVFANEQEAYGAWKNGEKVSSPWYDGEVNRRLTEGQGNKVDIAQELDIDYITSGNPYFDVVSLKEQKEWGETEDWINFDVSKEKVVIGKLIEVDNRVEFRPDKNGWLRLFETPRVGSQYVGGIDPAEGLNSSNYSCAVFRNKKTGNMVGGIYGKFDYDEMSYLSSITSRYFNNCILAAESGGYGAAVNKRLYDLGVNVAHVVDFSEGQVEEKDKLGWTNTKKSRDMALGDMEAEIREKTCELRDKDLIAECFNFVNIDGKPQAAEGATDDYVMAFAIAGQLMRFFPYSKEIEKEETGGGKSWSFKKPLKNMGFSFLGGKR